MWYHSSSGWMLILTRELEAPSSKKWLLLKQRRKVMMLMTALLCLPSFSGCIRNSSKDFRKLAYWMKSRLFAIHGFWKCTLVFFLALYKNVSIFLLLVVECHLHVSQLCLELYLSTSHIDDDDNDFYGQTIRERGEKENQSPSFYKPDWHFDFLRHASQFKKYKLSPICHMEAHFS